MADIYNIAYLRYIKDAETNADGPSERPSKMSITECEATIQRKREMRKFGTKNSNEI